MRLVLGLVLFGCTPKNDSGSNETESGTDPTGGCPTGALAVEAGTGSFAFEPLADGDRVEVTHGPQGGWHLWTGGTVTNTLASSILIAPKVTLSSDGTQLAGDQIAQSIPLGPTECGGIFYGGYAYLDDFQPQGMTVLQFICELEGKALQFTVDITDPDTGETATSSVEVIAARDPYDDVFCP